MSYQEFYELEVWKLARRFKNEVAIVLASFPSSEQFDLKSQLLLSARSVQANIAEGHGRQTPRDEARFLAIATRVSQNALTIQSRRSTRAILTLQSWLS